MSLLTSTDPRDFRRQQSADKWRREREALPNADRDKPSRNYLPKTAPARRHRDRGGATVSFPAATTGKAIRARLYPVNTCVVTILGNEHGHLDTQGIQHVARHLRRLVDFQNVRHLLMDLGKIESFTADFLHMLSELRSRLAQQNGEEI